MVTAHPQGVPSDALSPQTLKQLQSTSWSSELLKDPKLQPFNISSRIPKASTEDSAIAETLSTDETVKIWQAFYRHPSSSYPSGEFLCIISVGTGLNGHANTLHGGIISLLFDETTSLVAFYHQTSNAKSYTANLTVDFKKPIPTPGLLLCRAWLEPQSVGRKIWVRGTIEDGEGGVYALAQALFIEVPQRAQKL